MKSVDEFREQLAFLMDPGAWPATARQWVFIRLPPVIFVIVLLLLADTLARTTWNVVLPALWSPEIPSAVESHARSETDARPQRTAAPVSVADMHLFGEAKGEIGTAPVTPQSAPETSLGLTLHGVFIYSGPKDGAAIIGRAGDTQEFVRTGQSLANAVTLVEVRADHVLLQRRGRYETLYFPATESKGLDFKRSDTPARSVPGYAEMFRQNPDKIFEYVRIEPVTSGGKLQGYRLVASEHPELHEEFGILPSDVITAVNGIALQDQQTITQALSALASKNRIEVTLIRSGQQKTVTFQLN